MKIIWSPRALQRVAEISAYIAEDNVHAARRWVEELFDLVAQLADYPKIGRVVPEISSPQIRELIFGVYRVIYRIDSQIAVLTVRHGHQDLKSTDLQK